MSEIEHEKIYLTIQGLKAASEARDEIMNIRFSNIEKTTTKTLEHAEKTNGRVTVLEDDMKFMHWLRKNKWFFAVGLLAFMKVYETIPFKELFNIAIKLLTSWI